MLNQIIENLSEAKKMPMSQQYLNEPVMYGGEKSTRGKVIQDLKKQGGSQAMIDRYLQGMEAGKIK